MKQAIERAMDWIDDARPSKSKEAAMGVVAIAAIPFVFLALVGPPLAFGFGMAYVFDNDTDGRQFFTFVGLAVYFLIGVWFIRKYGDK